MNKKDFSYSLLSFLVVIGPSKRGARTLKPQTFGGETGALPNNTKDSGALVQ